MGKYVYYPPTPDNVLWIAQWDAMSLANLQNSDNVNARLTIKNRPKPSNPQIFENILEWEKNTTLIENISTANPYTDTPLLTIRNNYVGSQKHNADIEVFMNESKTHDSKLYTSYHDTTTNEMQISKKIFIADGDIFNKEYEKYLFTYNIFTQSNQSDKITVEMKANMTKGAPTITVSTTTPIKYEMERNGTGTTTTDLLTFGSQAQFNSGILNNLLIKKAGTITTEI